MDAFVLARSGLARMSHVSLECADLERALEFYRSTFGFETILELNSSGAAFEEITGVPGAVSRMVRGRVAGQSVVQLWHHSWRAPAEEHRTLLSFEVRDVVRAHRDLCDAGIACRSAPVDFENATAFVTADPDGHPIEIIQWKPGVEAYRPR